MDGLAVFGHENACWRVEPHEAEPRDSRILLEHMGRCLTDLEVFPINEWERARS